MHTNLCILVPDAQLILNASSARGSGSFCPGPEQFTCSGTETAILFYWTLNGVRISTYLYDTGHEFPRNLTLMDTSLPIEIQVVNASQIGLGINIVSTLTVSDVSNLNGASLQCQDALDRESNVINVTVTVKGTYIMVHTLWYIRYGTYVMVHTLWYIRYGTYVMVHTLWYIRYGTYIMVHTLWYIRYGTYVMVHTLWYIHYGTFIMVHTLWYIHYGTYIMVHTLWYIHYGTYIMVHTLWYIHYGT